MMVIFFGILVDHCPFRLGALYAKHRARLLQSPPFACPLPHRAARDRRGVPRSPTPRTPLPAQEKAERCERAQSVPARPAGRYAEPPAAALRPLSRDENSRNPAQGRRDATSDALHRQRTAPARFTSRRRVPRATRPSPGAASLRYARPPAHKATRFAPWKASGRSSRVLVGCLCRDLVVIQLRQVQLLRHDASVGTNLLDLMDRHYVLDAGGFGVPRTDHDGYAAGSRKRHNTERATALPLVAPPR
jgi:hypothetical protein